MEILEDGAPSGVKDFLIWDRPFRDAMAPNAGHLSSLSEATGLMRFLMKRGVRVILFCKVVLDFPRLPDIKLICAVFRSEKHAKWQGNRSSLFISILLMTLHTPQAMKAIRTELSAEGRLDILERVMSYRGGSDPPFLSYYASHLFSRIRLFPTGTRLNLCRAARPLNTLQDRRRIEREAFSGSLLGIIATNALELGVDIGVLDAVIMLGFPFGIANFVSLVDQQRPAYEDASSSDNKQAGLDAEHAIP